MNILYIDFETTGLPHQEGAAPIEFAAMLLTPTLQEISRFSTNVMGLMAGDVCYEGAMNVNKITVQELAMGRDPVLCAIEFFTWLEKHLGLFSKENQVMLAGHNVSFDKRFMEIWLQRVGMSQQMGWFHYRQVDVQVIAWANLVYTGKVEKTSLENCCKYFELEVGGHRAMTDVVAGVEVFRKLLQ